MRLVIPGLLVEYLISGAVALIWFVPLAERASFRVPLLDPLYLAPGIYVLGMFVDVIAHSVTKYPKRWIRHGVDAKYPNKELYRSGKGTA
jgi:hypothetical protein